MLIVLTIFAFAGVVYADDVDSVSADGKATTVVPAEEKGLTDFFRTYKGKSQMVDKVGWAGVGASWVVSMAGLAVLIGTMLGFAVNPAYLAMQTFWDQVEEVHNEGINAGGGTVISKAWRAFLYIVPNLKDHTDFSSRSRLSLSEDTTALGWVIKTLPGYLGNLIVASACFAGITQTIFAESIDGILVVGAKYEDLDLKHVVERAMNSDLNAHYLYNSGPLAELMEFKQKIAVEVHKEVMDELDTTNKDVIDEVKNVISSKMENIYLRGYKVQGNNGVGYTFKEDNGQSLMLKYRTTVDAATGVTNLSKVYINVLTQFAWKDDLGSNHFWYSNGVGGPVGFLQDASATAANSYMPINLNGSIVADDDFTIRAGSQAVETVAPSSSIVNFDMPVAASSSYDMESVFLNNFFNDSDDKSKVVKNLVDTNDDGYISWNEFNKQIKIEVTSVAVKPVPNTLGYLFSVDLSTWDPDNTGYVVAMLK